MPLLTLSTDLSLSRSHTISNRHHTSHHIACVCVCIFISTSVLFFGVFQWIYTLALSLPLQFWPCFCPSMLLFVFVILVVLHFIQRVLPLAATFARSLFLSQAFIFISLSHLHIIWWHGYACVIRKILIHRRSRRIEIIFFHIFRHCYAFACVFFPYFWFVDHVWMTKE